MAENKNEVAVIEKEINPTVRQAKELKINSSKAMERSAEFLTQLNLSLDALTESKERLTKPINVALKEIRDRYKPTEDMLKEAIKALRDEQSRYQTEQVKLEQAEEERIASRIGAGKGKLKVETAVKQIDEIDRVDSKINVKSGSLKFQKTKILKVVDLSLIPREYFNLDEKKTLDALKAGVKIPGAEVDIKMVPINSR